MDGLAFDGVDDYLTTPDIKSFFGSTTMTIELWFNAAAAGVIEMKEGKLLREVAGRIAI